MSQLEDRVIRLTPDGALAAAFSKLVAEAENPRAWWRTSPLLAGIGLAYHLQESGWEIRPIETKKPATSKRRNG